MATKGDQYSTHTGNIWNYAHRGDITGVEQALERGVDVNIANKAGWTPALAACAGGQTKLLQVLLHRGADLAAVDNAGRTVVHEAARNGELEVLKLLRKEGCDFGAKANNGQSAMDVAKGEATRAYISQVLAASKPAAGGAGGAGGAGKASSGWRRQEGGTFSGKAKKEYLKWKRAQKAQRAGGSSSDGEDDDEGAEGGSEAEKKEAVRRAGGQLRPGGGSWAPEAGSADGEEGAAAEAMTALHGSRQRQQAGAAEQVRAQPSRPKDDIHLAPAPAAEARLRGGKVTPSDAPLRYVPLVEVQQQQQQQQQQLAAAAAEASEAAAAALARLGLLQPPQPLQQHGGSDGPAVPPAKLARCHAGEVGFTPEGLTLGMPKRPAWRGVVRSGDELHALEEKAFDSWVQSLQSRFAPHRVSYYEPRLEYWRQLWRVLEACDVALMLVDARNPLLHFSHALVHHVMRDMRKKLVLVLSKCDLVPPAAVAEWAHFFSAHYPGIKVVPSVAANGHGRRGAEAIVSALLEIRIPRGSRGGGGGGGGSGEEQEEVPIHELVGPGRSVPDILDEAAHRNNVNKRQQQQQQQQAAAAGAAAEEEEVQQEEEAGSGGRDSASDEGGGCGGGREEWSDGGDDNESWAVKGNKMKKKSAVRKKKVQRHQKRMQGGSGAAAEAAAPPAVPAAGAKGGKKHQKQARGGGGGKGRRSDGGASSEDYTHTEEEGGERRGGGGDDAISDDDHHGSSDQEALDQDNNNDEFERLVADDDARHMEGGSGRGETEAAAEEQEVTVVGAGVLGPAETFGSQLLSQQARRQQRRRRPVVVCVVGEPNVGKSSTMNALLGSHKVSVSSHPGRTKHYQTHYMTADLMLVDCPGLVFPRLDVSLPMQILYGSYPIARCRDPYQVLAYLAERIWPRLHDTLGLRPLVEDADGTLRFAPADSSGSEAAAAAAPGGGGSARRNGGRRRNNGGGGGGDDDEAAAEESGLGAIANSTIKPWSPLVLCEAFALARNWKSMRSARLDTYRAANYILRAALAGRQDINLAFLPPDRSEWLPLAVAHTEGAPAAASDSQGRQPTVRLSD